MYSIKLDWKSFNLNLEAIEVWMKANAGETYSGNSADSVLTLWFAEEPSGEIRDLIETYWAVLDEESVEVTSYLTRDTIEAAVAAARTALLTKNWNDMSVAERKIVVGQTPTRSELGL